MLETPDYDRVSECAQLGCTVSNTFEAKHGSYESMLRNRTVTTCCLGWSCRNASIYLRYALSIQYTPTEYLVGRIKTLLELVLELSGSLRHTVSPTPLSTYRSLPR